MHSFAMMASARALVLTEKEINENGPCYVRLRGRKSGLVAWFLTLVGIDVTTEFCVYEDHIEISEGSVSGKVNELVPISSVSNLGTGLVKPFALLGVAVLFILSALASIGSALFAHGGAGSWASCLVSLLLAAACIFAYVVGRTMMTYVVTDGGTTSGIFVKRSIIESKTLSEEEVDRIIAILTKLVREKHQA